MAVGRPSRNNGLVNLLDKGLRFAAARLHDDRFILSSEEKSDLSDAVNEFQKYHNVPVMSPVWASRIGLASSLAMIVTARIDIVTEPAPASKAGPAERPAMPAPASAPAAAENDPGAEWLANIH